MIRNKLNIGQSLFELVVAIGVSALIIVAIVSLVTNAIRSATFSRNNAIGTSLGDDAVEWLRTQRDTDIVGFLANTSASPIYCFQALDWNTPSACTSSDLIENLYTRQGTFSTETISGKTVVHATITVSWTDRGVAGTAGSHVITNKTDFTDWRQR